MDASGHGEGAGASGGHPTAAAARPHALSPASGAARAAALALLGGRALNEHDVMDIDRPPASTAQEPGDSAKFPSNAEIGAMPLPVQETLYGIVYEFLKRRLGPRVSLLARRRRARMLCDAAAVSHPPLPIALIKAIPLFVPWSGIEPLAYRATLRVVDTGDCLAYAGDPSKPQPMYIVTSGTLAVSDSRAGGGRGPAVRGNVVVSGKTAAPRQEPAGGAAVKSHHTKGATFTEGSVVEALRVASNSVGQPHPHQRTRQRCGAAAAHGVHGQGGERQWRVWDESVKAETGMDTFSRRSFHGVPPRPIAKH